MSDAIKPCIMLCPFWDQCTICLGVWCVTQPNEAEINHILFRAQLANGETHSYVYILDMNSENMIQL